MAAAAVAAGDSAMDSDDSAEEWVADVADPAPSEAPASVSEDMVGEVPPPPPGGPASDSDT
jgi:hypothetical protein